ncbi:hypothetical protein KEM54_001443 [Ascosphaera aggregata]|nr:hypothetical protein KEM54_001443 [Ascosphaera aggregata]
MDESDDDDADTVSITSTVFSEACSDYEFEEIISETKVRGVNYYLVSWTNYNLDESTWEPLHHFDDPEQALKNWEETKAAIERGEKRPVDIFRIRRKAIDREIAAQKRRIRRRAKRKASGIPVDSESEIELTPGDFDRWEPSEASDDDDREEELRSQPIWAAFKPIRFRKPIRRSIAATPRRRSSIVSADSSSSKQSRTTQDEERQAGKIQSTAITARSNSMTSSTDARGQTRQTTASSSSRSRLAERGRVGKTDSTSSASRSETSSSKADYIIPVAGSPSVSRVFDPRLPSSAQRVLANIKSRKQSRAAQNPGYMYKRLSTMNRVRKAGREEPPPDINQLEFITPGECPQPGRQQERQERYDNIFERGRDDTRPVGQIQERGMLARRRSIDQSTSRPPAQSRPGLPPSGPFSQPVQRSGASSAFIPRNISRPPPPKLKRKKRAFRRDKEALLYLRTKEKIIGHVKIGEIPPADSNTLMAGGYVKPFDDTLRALRDFVRDLKNKRQAALFYHPDGEVFMLYPAEVEEWKFLNRSSLPSVVGAELRYALSISFPRLSELPPGTADKPIELGGDSFTGLGGGGESFVGFDDELQDVIADVTMRDVSPEPPPSTGLNISVLDTLDKSGVLALFEERFHVTMEYLTAVNGDAKRARYFYLGFPEETKGEFEFLQVALERCGMELFSNLHRHQHLGIRPGNDWISFRRMTENDPGTILLHETSSNFSSLSYFTRTLRQHINVFYVSMARPLTSTVDKHFEMIFPHGGAVLLTDEVITRTPKRALAIVRQGVGGKLQPSLLDDDAYIYHPQHTQQGNRWDEVDEGQFNPFISMKYIPRYGVLRDSEVDDSLKGADDMMKNTDQLIEWFAGWSLMNVERFRKFTAVVNVKTKVLERWRKWAHIEVLDSRRFIGQYPKLRNYDPFG